MHSKQAHLWCRRSCQSTTTKTVAVLALTGHVGLVGNKCRKYQSQWLLEAHFRLSEVPNAVAHPITMLVDEELAGNRVEHGLVRICQARRI